jgi:hypothetical protein
VAYVFIFTCMNEYLKDLELDVRIILRRILNKYEEMAWTGYRIELAQHRDKQRTLLNIVMLPSCSINYAPVSLQEIIRFSRMFCVIELASYCTNDGVKGDRCIHMHTVNCISLLIGQKSPRNTKQFRLHLTRFHTKSHWMKKGGLIIVRWCLSMQLPL